MSHKAFVRAAHYALIFLLIFSSFPPLLFAADAPDGQGTGQADPPAQAPQGAAAAGGENLEYTQERDPVKANLNLNTDAATGAFTYSYPLAVPPGRNGVQPSLSLNYHSQDLRNDNQFGYGWSASIPFIERIPRKGADKLYDGVDEYFSSSLSGELEKISQGGMGMAMAQGENDGSGVRAMGLPSETTAGFSALPSLEEQIGLRTENSKTFLAGYKEDGRPVYTARMYPHAIHYFDPATSLFEDIDARLADKGDYWGMDAAPYRVRLDRQTGEGFLSFINKAQELSFSLPKNINPSIGRRGESEHEAIFDNALASGISLSAALLDHALVKEAVIENLEALGDLTGKAFFEIPFLVKSNAPLALRSGDTLLKRGAPLMTDQEAVISSNGATTYLYPPYARDQAGDAIPIAIRYEQVDDATILLTKLIPAEWLLSAAYPVRTDATLSPFPAPGDGSVYHKSSSLWSGAHDAASGSAVTTGSTLYVRSGKYSTTYYYIERAFLPFNTEELPDGTSIISAALNVYVSGKRNDFNDGKDWVTVVQTSQATTSSLVADDYDQCGSIHTPAEGIDITERKDITSVAAGQYLSFNLNAAGISWINGAGYTRLGLREGHDAADSTFTMSLGTKYNELDIRTSEYAGTAQDPYLEITYASNSAPSAPTSLTAEQQANPTGVSDITPEFSSVYGDPDAGDIATHYQIQATATQGDWINLVWDSGKTALAAPIATGLRSEEISYAGTALVLNGATYWWRMKYWDDENAEGAWSAGSDTFAMANQQSAAVEYGAKIENGEFLKYVFDNNTWTVTDKKGTVYTFGLDTASRQDSGSKIYKWMLQKIQDTAGNYVRYEYFKDAGQIYPSKIYYTGNGADAGIFEIEFLRQARNDKAVLYATGFPVATNYRISEILAKVSGVWRRKYALGYSAGDNGVRSLLNSITESGQDESGGIITLPAATFNYSVATKSWTLNTSFVLPIFFVSGSLSGGVHDNGVRLDEADGNGLVDIAQGEEYQGGNINNVQLNNGDGTGWTLASGFSLSEFFTTGTPPRDTGTRLIDADGDGYADLVRGDNTNGVNIRKVYINNKNNTGWAFNAAYVQPEFFVIPQDQGIRFADVNADGLVDLNRGYNDGYTTDKSVYLNDGDGTGWTENTSFILPEYFTGIGDFGTRFMDVNGDGLNDVVRSYNDGFNQIKKVYINKGDGTWVEDSAYVLPEYFASPADRGVRLADVNGDGLVDVLKAYYNGGIFDGNKVYLNSGNGSGWAWDQAYTIPELFATNVDEGTRLADVNSDGLLDIIRGDNVDDANVKKVYFHNGVIPDLLTHVTSHTAAQTSITYQASTQYRDGSNNLLNPSLPFSVQTVKQITTDDGRGTLSNTTYSYEGGFYYFNNPYDRKLAGFQKVAETDHSGNVTKTFYHQGNATDSVQGEYADHISKRGKPYRVEQFNNAGNLFSKTISKWEHVLLGGDRYFVKKTQVINFSYDGDADHRDTASTYAFDGANGNLTQKKEWGEVTGSDNGTFTDTGADIFTTDIQYASNQTAYIIGLSKQETTTDQSAQKVSETKHYYDLQALGSVTKGNETKTEHWVTGTAYIDIEKAYNATYGLVTQEKDPRDKATNYTYDTGNLYPATVTNALNQQTQYLYDYSSGKVTQVTDPNTRVFQTAYDGLDRVKEEKQPDKATPTTLVTKSTYAYNDTANPRSVIQTNYLTDSLTHELITYIDGLDRTIQTRTRAEDANTYSIKDIIYDPLGRVQKESLPYFSTGSTHTPPTANQQLFTNYSYDALGRVLTASNVIGTTSHTYDQWKETVTDAKGKIKDYTSDAYGNLIKVEEHNSAAIYTTNYTYNGLSKLLNITDALGNVRNFTYDGLGRRLTAQDLHAPADGTFGAWAYTYDAASNLVTQLDPKNQTVNYTYDDLNRVSAEDYTGQTGAEVAYTYDTCTEGKGRLCSVNADADTVYTYYATGEVKTEQKTIDSSSYTTTYTYDRQGNTINIKYPDLSEVQYAYNAGGLTETVQKKESGGAFTNVVTDFDYSPLGQITTQANANNTVTANTYDQNVLYRLTRKQTTGPGGGGGGAPVTVSFYPITGDGYIYYRSSWDTAHHATSGSSANYSNSALYVRTGRYSTSSYQIDRAFLPFNTETLPNDATITSAQLKVYVASKKNHDNDGNDWITVVQTSQATTTSLSTGDYDQCGSIHTPAEGIDSTERKDITSVATSQFLTFNLNATGLSWISKTGATRLGLREGHDVIDSSFYSSSTGKYNELSIRTLNYTGTTYDPVLEVTYTEAAPPSPANLQDISYIYDAVGNITQITDSSGTDTAKTTAYTYDDLHRLSTAVSTNAANGQNYNHTYVYDAIGNITNMTGVGAYLYQGTNYANPHAVTKVGSAVYAYDNNGNLTSDSTWTHSWNYQNKLTQSQKTGSTVTYQYDHTGQRTKYVNGTKTIRYANKLYNTDGTIATKHIYAGNQLVGTVEGTTLQYIHTDHLTGSNVATNTAGGMVQLLDYYPYGALRIDWKSGTFDEQRKFTGHEFDRDTSLTYANARYYKQNIGRFISQDPAVVQSPEKLLLDPQKQNFYAYARNNPLIYTDPTGNLPILIPIGLALANPAAMGVIVSASLGLITSVPLIGQSIGYLIEGDTANSQRSSEAAIYSQAASGLGAAASLQAGNAQSRQMSSASANQSKAPQTQLEANKAQGRVFEQQTQQNLERRGDVNIRGQVTIRTESGVKTKPDFISMDPKTGRYYITESKSSDTARLTPNQSMAFPEIQQSGATVVGQGKAPYTGGTFIPPTKVDVVRP